MTQDEIMEMARESGFFVKDNDAYSPSVQEDHELTPFLERFAHLVSAKATEEANARANASWTLMCEKMVAFEREACAKVCEKTITSQRSAWGANFCIAAIRARGEQA